MSNGFCLLKIAILTRTDFRSPRILAESLKLHLKQKDNEVEIFNEINLLNRLVSLKVSKLSFHYWLKRKLASYFNDKNLIKELKKFDAIIISDCAPNGFFKNLYNVEKFKKIIQRPVGFYEVYYLGNAPTQIEFLRIKNEPGLERFDFHLSVSSTTEIKQSISDNYYPIGVKGESFHLKPLPKKELVAIIDFVFPGNELFRKLQIETLKKAGIKYIALEGSYTIEEIRKIYQQGSIYFMQSSEAFGLPILECLSCGCQIFSPESWWPMSWRLNENPEVHGPGILPDCFTIYDGEKDLSTKLETFKTQFNPVHSPKKIFTTFFKYYPSFYNGDGSELRRFINYLQNGKNNIPPLERGRDI